jgi:presenilin-like A22 family membrane protease
VSEEAPAEPVDLRREAPAIALMALLFLASIGLAMAFSFTFQSQNIRAFQDPQSLANPLIYLGIVVVFTLGILLIAKYGRRVIIKYVILGSVLLTIYYVAWPLLASVLGQGAPLGPAEVLGALVALALTGLLWFYPEWYVIDLVGIAVAAGAAGIFGISFGLLPCLLLLVAFAAYDAIAVYRTKHMLALADSVLELRLPIMFVVPKSRRYSFLEETRRAQEASAAARRTASADAPALALAPELRSASVHLRVKPERLPAGAVVSVVKPDGERADLGDASSGELSFDAPRDALGEYVFEARERDASGAWVVVASTRHAVEKRREAMFMGLGDAVIPAILVVSAMTFLPGAGSWAVALTTLAGSFVGFLVLMGFVLKGRPHAGLPLLNGGAIVGFFAALVPLYGLAPLNPFR